jgi:putative transposase
MALRLALGAVVRHGQARVRIVSVLRADRLLVEPCDSEDPAYSVRVSELKADQPTLSEQLEGLPLSRYSVEEWERVGPLAKCLLELHEAPHRRRSRAAAAAARELNMHVSRVWYWYGRFRNSGFRAISLLQRRRGPDAGLASITGNEAIIEDVLAHKYETQERRPVAAFIERIRDKCRRAKVKVPSRSTIYRQARRRDERQKIKKRHSAAAARKKFNRVRGPVPKGAGPLDLVLIDHTQLKVNAVDSVHRKSIGPAWLTIAIDAYSRAIWGIHVSPHRPNATSVALCMANGLLPKDEYLKRLGVKGRWPVYGPPRHLSYDGAKEFKTAGFLQGCALHDIYEPKPRKPGRPHYGALIERFIGTLMNRLRMLRGRVFRNLEDRKEYKSDKKAYMTCEEIERWIVTDIVQRYHHRIHGGTGEPPIVRYETAMLARDELPPVPQDPARVRLDFLPRKLCTVQLRGIRWDNAWYWGDILQDYINKGLPQRVWVRRDDRDVNIAYVEHDNDYIPIETNADRSAGRDAQRRAKAYLKAIGVEAYERQLVLADEELARVERDAARRTKTARRRQETRRHDAQAPRYSPSTKSARRKAQLPSVPPARKRARNPFPNIDGE